MKPINAINLPLLGKNVRIDKFRQFDLPTLYAIETDCQVKKYLGGPVKATESDWISRILSRWDRFSLLAVRTEEDRAPIGRAALNDNLDGTVDMEIVLGEAGRGQRLGRQVAGLLVHEARRMGAEQVSCKTHRDNEHAQNLLRTFGFSEHGLINGGKYCGFKKYRLDVSALKHIESRQIS